MAKPRKPLLPEDVETLLNPEEAGAKLGMKADYVRRLCKDGDLAYVRLGRREGSRVGIRPEDLQAFIDSRVVPARDRSNPTLARIRERSRRQTA